MPKERKEAVQKKEDEIPVRDPNHEAKKKVPKIFFWLRALTENKTLKNELLPMTGTCRTSVMYYNTGPLRYLNHKLSFQFVLMPGESCVCVCMLRMRL